MSYGPLKNCYTCKKPLDISDPRNQGYCEVCETPPAEMFQQLEQAQQDAGPKPKGNRKQRRKMAAEARKAKK